MSLAWNDQDGILYIGGDAVLPSTHRYRTHTRDKHVWIMPFPDRIFFCFFTERTAKAVFLFPRRMPPVSAIRVALSSLCSPEGNNSAFEYCQSGCRQALRWIEGPLLQFFVLFCFCVSVAHHPLSFIARATASSRLSFLLVLHVYSWSTHSRVIFFFLSFCRQVQPRGQRVHPARPGDLEQRNRDRSLPRYSRAIHTMSRRPF